MRCQKITQKSILEEAGRQQPGLEEIHSKNHTVNSDQNSSSKVNQKVLQGQREKDHDNEGYEDPRE